MLTFQTALTKIGAHVRTAPAATCTCTHDVESHARRDTDPILLFDAPTVRKESNPRARICRHLQDEARTCHYIVLWLDCDREGENICFEVLDNTERFLLPVR